MKKIILGIVFVFASITMVNANTSIENENFNNHNGLDSIESILEVDCFELAWEYGTDMGNGDPYLEWYYTNSMYNFCLMANEVFF